jgi:hypothetical protein
MNSTAFPSLELGVHRSLITETIIPYKSMDQWTPTPEPKVQKRNGRRMYLTREGSHVILLSYRRR